MRLTEPIHLSAVDLETIGPEMAAINQSTLTMTPLGELRYSAVPPDEAQRWLESCCRADLRDELSYPRITDLDTDGLGPDVIRFEHLVIRDLDLEPLHSYHAGQASSASHDPGRDSRPAGRIVAYAEFKYHPLNKEKQTDEHGARDSDKEPPASVEPSMEIPTSAHRELHEYWNNAVEAALDFQFSHLHCFEVRGLATLSPSHLRKGIASKLLPWIFPWADRLNVPVVLAATPPGYPLYLRHGFVELGGRDGVVECDMAEWGGSGIHRHILMTRSPSKA